MSATSTTSHKKTAVLKAENIHRYLGEGENRVHVLKGVNLDLEPAKIYSISGPSGCGKSTLLYLLGLLDRQDKGQIWIDNELMSEASDRDRTIARNKYIGFIFQFHFLLPEFTAEENVMLPMKKQGTRPLPQMQERAQMLLGHVGLESKRHRRTSQLSGGEQQRVAIARALANKPRLILADEPTGNLDVANSDHVFNLLKKIAHEDGQTILMVTHNKDLAQTTDHTLRMQDGLFV